MICVSIAEPSPHKCLELLKEIDFAEIRIDKMDAHRDDIQKIFSQHPKLIATCRPGTLDDEKRRSRLEQAISAGAAFVDIELEAGDQYKKGLIERARSSGCRIIISYHNYDKTPNRAELEHIISWCFVSGADITKIACRVRSKKESARLLGLLEDERPLVVVGMGADGKICRITSPFLGSLFTYASLEPGKETADGQMDRKTLINILQTLKNV